MTQENRDAALSFFQVLVSIKSDRGLLVELATQARKLVPEAFEYACDLLKTQALLQPKRGRPRKKKVEAAT